MNNQNFQKSEEYEAYEPWLGKSTLLASGPRWHKLRKLVTPGFHFSILENFIPIFEEHAMTLTNKYKMIGNKCVDVFPINALFTADVIAGNTLLNPQSNQFIFLLFIIETSMGTRINAQTSETEYTTAVHEYVLPTSTSHICTTL